MTIFFRQSINGHKNGLRYECIVTGWGLGEILRNE